MTAMWFLLVATLSSALLTDAGYLYNSPRVPISFHKQPVRIHRVQYQKHGAKTVQGNQEDKSYQISYKDYVYIKKGNVNNAYIHKLNPSINYPHAHANVGHTKVNRGNVTPQNTPTNLGYSNNDYVGYSQPLTPTINYNNDYREHHHAVTTINNVRANVGANVGYNQVSPLPANAGYSKTSYSPATGSYTNSYIQSSTANVNQNSGYSQAFTDPGVDNYNNGYAQISESSAPVAHLNNGDYVQSTYATGGYNYGNAEVQIQASDPLSSGYKQAAHANALYNNGYNQVATNVAGSNLNTDYLHSFSSSSNFNTNKGSSSSVNNGFAQTSSNFNNGNEQTGTSIGTTSFNTGYGLPTAISNANVNNVFAPSAIPTASSALSASHQASTGPTHIDLNSGILQTLAQPESILDNSLTQILSSDGDNFSNGLSNGLQDGNLNSVINSAPVGVPSNPPVTPIIHKHIYFHVPPPEIEEPLKVVQPPPPPPQKKDYKIIFIKVPLQESKTNVARLQQEIAKRLNVAAEDKTLIYVLVNKPEEPEPIVLPPPKQISEHQVFFVKYDGSPLDIASQVNDELHNTGTIKSIVPLEPGLTNGQHE